MGNLLRTFIRRLASGSNRALIAELKLSGRVPFTIDSDAIRTVLAAQKPHRKFRAVDPYAVD